jgi:hypothetical protein
MYRWYYVFETFLGLSCYSTDWRKLHNEELNNLYSSPNIIRMIKSRRMRWAGHVARMGEEECIGNIGGEVRKKETTRTTKT